MDFVNRNERDGKWNMKTQAPRAPNSTVSIVYKSFGIVNLIFLKIQSFERHLKPINCVKTTKENTMNAQRVPISQLLTDKTSIEDDPNQKKTREDWRKAKELEEARKAGNAPAAVDEEGLLLVIYLFLYIFTKQF